MIFLAVETPLREEIFAGKLIYPDVYRNFRKNFEISEPGGRNGYKTESSSEVLEPEQESPAGEHSWSMHQDFFLAVVGGFEMTLGPVW
jgi:hypothetical protein